MDEEQNKWSDQYAKHFGAKELFRFGCVFMTFLSVGITLGVALRNAGIIMIFVVTFLGTLWLAPYWQPAYSIVHKTMGNPNIPSILPKYQRKWGFYTLIAIKVILLLATLGLGIQLLFK